MAARDGGGWAAVVQSSFVVAGPRGATMGSTPRWPHLSQSPVVTSGPTSPLAHMAPCPQRFTSPRLVASPPTGHVAPTSLPLPLWDPWASFADQCSARKAMGTHRAAAAAVAWKGADCFGIVGELVVCGLRRGGWHAAGAGASAAIAATRTTARTARSGPTAMFAAGAGGSAQWSDSGGMV